MTDEDEQYLAELLEELFRRIEIIEKRVEAISSGSGANPEEKA